MIFINEGHKIKYFTVLNKMRGNDCYHQAVAYLLTLDEDCYDNINDLYDFEDNCIKARTGLHHAWQTETSLKTTRLAYNLWNGCASDYETKGCEDRIVLSNNYAVDEIFCCSYAPYFWQAIQLRYPEYCTID